MAADCQPTATVAQPAAVKPVVVVVMQVKLPYTIATFTPEVQDNFKIGVASAASAGCKCQITSDDVNITRISEALRRVLAGKPPADGMSRRAAEGVQVDFSIAVADSDQGSALVQSGFLSQDTLNDELAQVGVSPITEVTQRPAVTGGTGNPVLSNPSTFEESLIWVLIVASSVLIVFGFSVYYAKRRGIVEDDKDYRELLLQLREVCEKLGLTLVEGHAAAASLSVAPCSSM